jgi:hypothetical protein
MSVRERSRSRDITKKQQETINSFTHVIDTIFLQYLTQKAAACSPTPVTPTLSPKEVATLLLEKQIEKLIHTIRQHLTRESVLATLFTQPSSAAATDADINLLNIKTKELYDLTQLLTSEELRKKAETAFLKVYEIKQMIASNPNKAYELLSQQAIAKSLRELHEAITGEHKDFIQKFAVAVSEGKTGFVYDNTPAILELSIKTAWDRYKAELRRDPTSEDMKTFLRENPDTFEIGLLAGRDFTPGHGYINGLIRYEKYCKYLLREYIKLFLNDVLGNGLLIKEDKGRGDKGRDDKGRGDVPLLSPGKWVPLFLDEVIKFIESSGVPPDYMCQLKRESLNNIQKILKEEVAEMIKNFQEGGRSHSRIKSKKARHYKRRASTASKASRRYRRRTTKQKRNRSRTRTRTRTGIRTRTRTRTRTQHRKQKK